MLIAILAGIAHQNLYLLQVDTTGLYLSDSILADFSGLCKPIPAGFPTRNLFNGIAGTCLATRSPDITATDIGIHPLYDVNLWGYCYTPRNGSRVCSTPALDWAELALNTTKSTLEDWVGAAGQSISLHESVETDIHEFGLFTRFAEVFSVVAALALAVALLFGVFATRSRVVSCVAFLAAAVATVAVCIAAISSALMAVGATAVFKYGAQADVTWCILALPVGAVLALAASVFWLLTCCAP